MIMLLIAAASPFGWVMTIQQIPQAASAAILGLSRNPVLIYALMLVIYLILGTFMETGAIILLVVPIFAPIAMQLGIDMIHFGVVTVIALAIGMATPPVGIALFATCSIAGITIGQLTRKIIPFLFILIVGLFFLAYVPILSTYLPNLMFK